MNGPGSRVNGRGFEVDMDLVYQNGCNDVI
jgi:hypothetical protein